ncbi:MAG: hypothetical protein AB9888_15560 [Bacteroidales bacterium]
MFYKLLVTLAVIVLLIFVSLACNSSSPYSLKASTPEMLNQPEEVITPTTVVPPTKKVITPTTVASPTKKVITPTTVASPTKKVITPTTVASPTKKVIIPTTVASPVAEVAKCSESFYQLETSLVAQGKAVASDYVWDKSAGNFKEIDPSITAEGCSVLKSSMGILKNAGCNLDSATQAAEAYSNKTDSDYRSCKRRFPDNWDKKCQLQFSVDQQAGWNHIKLMDIANWLNICK